MAMEGDRRPPRQLLGARTFGASEAVAHIKATAQGATGRGSRDDHSHFDETSRSDESHASRAAPDDAAESSPPSSSSSHANIFSLASPFPRPQPARIPPPRPLSDTRRGTNDENAAPGVDVPTSSTFGKSKASAGSAPLSTHIRISAKPSTSFFPYRSSILATSSSFVDLRTQSRLDQERKSYDEYVPRTSDEANNSDVDLDLSFDFQGNTRGSPARQKSTGKDWVGIDMVAEEPDDDDEERSRTSSPMSGGSSGLEEDLAMAPDDAWSSLGGRIPESEMVRSPSGKLLGTKKRIKSAIELRQAFLEGEKELLRRNPQQVQEAFAILMDGGEEQDVGEETTRLRGLATEELASKAGGPGTARREWVRKTTMDPTLRLGTVSRARVEGSSTYHRSIGKGFAYNPTDPLTIPLPDSPMLSPLSPSTEWMGDSSRVGKTLPRQLLERTRIASPLASPAWSITTFLMGNNASPRDSASIRQSIDMRTLDDQGAPSPRPNWADELAKSTLQYLGMRQRAPPSDSEASSPVFGGMTPSDFGKAGSSNITTPTSPISPWVEEFEDSVEATLYRDGTSTKVNLAGLGLNFVGEPIPPPPTRHITIPSLSVTAPPSSPLRRIGEDDEDDESASSASGDSVNDPVVSPSRRLSRLLLPSHARTGSHNTLGRTYYTRPPTPHFGPRPSKSNDADVRFAFTPVPLTLVSAQFLPISPIYDLIIPTSSSPAKFFFLAGFFLGPWWWMLGGWWVRPMDGELRSSRCGGTDSHNGARCSLATHRAGGRAGKMRGGVDEWVYVCRVASVLASVLVAGTTSVAVAVAAGSL